MYDASMIKSTTQKKKMGRPALPDGEKRETLSFRASPDEKRVIESAAERDGARLTTWMRNTLLAAAGGKA